MIKYLNFISLYLKIKKNIERLKEIKSKYIFKNNQLKKEKKYINKNIYQKMKKEILKDNKVIRNEILKNYKLMKYLKKLQS